MSDTKKRLLEKRGPVEREVDGVGKILIRRLKCNEMLALSDEKDSKEGLRKIVALCLVEADGKPIFSAAEVGDLDWADVKAISDVAMEVNKLTMKDAEKKSPTLPSSP